MLGFGGIDRLEGGAHDDYLHGGDGADMLFGGSGKDVLVGTAGRDEMTGGTGSDNFLFYASATAALPLPRATSSPISPRAKATSWCYSRVFRPRFHRPAAFDDRARSGSATSTGTRGSSSMPMRHGRNAHPAHRRDQPERGRLRVRVSDRVGREHLGRPSRLPKPAGAYPPANARASPGAIGARARPRRCHRHRRHRNRRRDPPERGRAQNKHEGRGGRGRELKQGVIDVDGPAWRVRAPQRGLRCMSAPVAAAMRLPASGRVAAGGRSDRQCGSSQNPPMER